MKQYLDGLDILLNGREGYRVVERMDRTGTGTRGFFGHQMRFDLTKGFPLLTTKAVNFNAIVHELLWFLKGSTNIKDLNTGIWNNWAVTHETIIRERVLPLLKSDDEDANNELINILSQKHLHCAFVKPNEDSPEGMVRCADIDGDALSQQLYIDPKKYWAAAVVECVEHGVIDAKELEKLGTLGPVYGALWRNWPAHIIHLKHDQEDKKRFMESGLSYGEWLHSRPEMNASVKLETIDQIGDLIENLKKNPYSRRHVISGWNPAALPDESVKPDVNAYRGKQALPPCHTLFQFYVEPLSLKERVLHRYAYDHTKVQELYKEHLEAYERHSSESIKRTQELLELILNELEIPDKRLSCQLYQRSCDAFLGMPFNIASYALLTHILAQICGYEVGDFIHTFGDIHLYNNHHEQAREQLSREPRTLPTLLINPACKKLEDFTIDSFRLVGYEPHEHIKAPVSV